MESVMKAIPIDLSWRDDFSIYASEAFLKTISREYGWLGGVDSAREVRCILPYSVIRKAGMRLVRFPVQTIPLECDLSLDEERDFLNSAADFFRLASIDVIVPATFNTVFRVYPANAIAAPFGSYVIDLTLPEEDLWSKVHAKHRNVIRNATKKGVVIKTGTEQLETAYRLVQDSVTRSARGLVERMRVSARMDYRTFRHQMLAFGEFVRVFVAEYEGVAQSAAVIPFSRHCAYYMHGGSIESPLTGASNLLQWEAIRQFRAQGVRSYDFFGGRVDPESGSKMEGIMKFKERFGGRFIEGFMWKLPFNPIKYGIYGLAARLRNGGDVVDQEQHKLGRIRTASSATYAAVPR